MSLREENQSCRAILEIFDGQLKIYPIADSDIDEQRIIDAIRVAIRDE